jgi:hypothetical protein
LLAALAAATFAVTPTFWSQAVIAEVYGLHVFFVVLLFYLLLAWAEHRRTWLLLLAACSFGLSLAHHSTTLLLAPALLVYVWLTDRRVFRDRRLLLEALLLVLLPLLFYLYIPLRAPHTPYLRLPLAEGRELVLYENTPSGFVYFVLGGPFGGSVDLTVDLGQRLAMAWGFLRGQVGWIGIVLALGGVTWLVVARRWALLTLTGLTYVASVAFNLVYTIGDIHVLYIPSYVVVVLWMAAGVGVLVSPVRRWRIASALLAAVFFVLPLLMALGHYARVDQSANTRARQRWEAILSEPLPPGSVLVSDDRNNIMPLWYFQYVGDGRPLRPDLLGLFPLITPEYPSLGHVLDLALGTDRTVYLIKEMPGIEVKVEVEADGRLWRVLGPAAEGDPDQAVDIHLADAVALVGYDRSPHSPRPGGPLQVRLYWEALRPLDTEYHSFVHLLDDQGVAIAQSDRQPGGIFYPTTLWRPGERLRDDHLLAVPEGTSPGVYRLLAGMYASSREGGLEPLGEPVIIGSLGVKTVIQAEPGDIEVPLRASFAGQLELLGYDLALQDRMLAVSFHWRCVRPPDADYAVFVHLLDARGETVVQHDGWPQGGVYPTSICDEGEVLLDEHPLLLPANLPPGDYRLRVGLYRPESGERLSVAGGGDSVELGPVELGD